MSHEIGPKVRHDAPGAGVAYIVIVTRYRCELLLSSLLALFIIIVAVAAAVVTHPQLVRSAEKDKLSNKEALTKQTAAMNRLSDVTLEQKRPRFVAAVGVPSSICIIRLITTTLTAAMTRWQLSVRPPA